MRIQVTIATAGVLGLTLTVGLAGCGWLSGDFGGSDGGVRDVYLAASPTPGMRASYRVQTGAILSGPGVRLLTDAQKSASTVQRYVVAVTAVEADAFDVRITGDSLPGAVIARFRRDWSALRFGIENEGKFTEGDLPSFPILGEAFQVARDLSGRWTVGEARPWARTVNVPPLLSVEMQGKATLKRITRVTGRRAAEFDFGAAGEGEYAGTRLRMSLRSQYWVDLATSFVLESRTTASGQFTPAGEMIHLELKEERTLNSQDSAGF
jgi:hypothetical protein